MNAGSKYAGVLAWFQGLWPGKQLAQIHHEPELGLGMEHKGDYFLRFDRFGELIGCSQRLQSSLVIQENGRRLEDIVTEMPLWLEGSPDEWPRQIPELVLKSRNSLPMVMAGCLLEDDEDWVIHLVDVSESSRRLKDLERRRLFLEQASQSAALLKSEMGETESLLLDWLEEQCLRLQVPVAAVLLKEASGWRRAQQYSRRGAGSGGCFLSRALADTIEQLHSPLQWRDDDNSPVWLVPYCEQRKVVACLYIGGLEAVQQVDWLSPHDWYQLFENVAAPLIRAQERHHAKEVQRRYQTVATMLSGGWWEYSLASQRLQLSEQLAHKLGFAGTECLLEPEQWLALLAPQHRESFQLKLESMVTRGGNFSQEVQLQSETGGDWYIFEGMALQPMAEEGKETRVTGFAFNINDTRRKEIEAEAAKARMQGLIDGVPGLIYMQHYNKGGLSTGFCSASLESLLGWSQEELKAKPFASFIHPDDRDTYFNKMKLLLQTGQVGQQYRMQCKDGGYRWMQAETRLLRDEEGIPQEVIGVCLDITENKKAVERVYKSEESYRALVEDSPAIICRYKPDLSITFANTMLSSSLNVDPDVIRSLNLGDYMSAKVKEQALQRITALNPDNPHVTTEVCIRRGNQDYRWWVLFESGLFDKEGRLLEVQAVGRDNTELHQARNQLIQSAKMATLGEMATGLAHEVNQPLNVIHMSLTNLLSHIRKQNADESYIINKVERVADQVQRAAGIIDHVRTFGRQSDIEGVQFNPASAVEGALSLLQEKLQKEDIALRVQLERMPDVTGHADRLEQVLMNLIMNAGYAVKEQRKRDSGLIPEILVTARSLDKKQVVLSVKDNGGGVDESLLDRVFEPFFTTKPFGEGTGLGLSLSYSIVKQMSGQLLLENDKTGAVFSIVLPVASANQQTEIV